MRFLRRSLTGLALVALTIGLLAFGVGQVREAAQALAAEEPRSRPARERVFAVNAVVFEPGRIEPVLEVFGEVQSRRTLDVRTSVAGSVIALHPNFVEGGVVAEGDVLVQIDPADAETRVALASADMSDAQAEALEAARALELAQDDLVAAQDQAQLRARALARQQDLVDRGVGTEAALESAELALSSAQQAALSRRSALQQAEARVNTASIRVERAGISLTETERELANTTIRAGFDGVLSDVTLVEGGRINANERVASLVDPQALEVAVRVSTPQYARLTGEAGLAQSPVVVTLDVFGVDLTAQGRVTRESAAVGEGQTGRLLFVSLDAARGFRPGDFVTVEISEPAVDGVARLPSAALSAAGNVLVIGEDERLSEAAVELVRRQGDDVLVRARGLAGQSIVAERSPLLGAGIKVRAIGGQDGNADGGPAAA
ncbi:MAG: HlyD family efflux transporter periplasmic adaptor subunit, partial [Pseudomonadota bacterium]